MSSIKLVSFLSQINKKCVSLITNRLEVLKMDASLKSKEKRKEWTWKQQTDIVKWQGTQLAQPLLRLDSGLVQLALECFECILRYCGDLQPGPNGSPDEVSFLCVCAIFV